MIVKIDVTHEDIELGVPKSICSCPVARALKKVGYSEVCAGYDEIQIDNYYGSTPLSVECFMVDFDNGRSCSPFSFEIDVREKPEENYDN